MGEKIDLNRIKEEINNRKNEIMMEQNSSINISGGIGTPQKSFLHGLLEARKHGIQTSSAKIINEINNKAEEKLKGKKTPIGTLPKNSNYMNAIPRQMPINENIELNEMQERDELLFKKMDSANKSLIDSLIEYEKAPLVGTPMQNQTVNYNQQVPLNEAMIVENIKKMVNNYLAENLPPIIQEAFRDTIIEMYSIERIKEVLQENKEMIKSVVVEVIKEIKARSKENR